MGRPEDRKFRVSGFRGFGFQGLELRALEFRVEGLGLTPQGPFNRGFMALDSGYLGYIRE